MEKYFKGDIVEVVSSPYANINEIPDHLKNNFNCHCLARGFRYRVDLVVIRTPSQSIPFQHCFVWSTKMLFGSRDFNLMLYKRPFRNWLKYFWYKFKQSIKHG